MLISQKLKDTAIAILSPHTIYGKLLIDRIIECPTSPHRLILLVHRPATKNNIRSTPESADGHNYLKNLLNDKFFQYGWSKPKIQKLMAIAQVIFYQDTPQKLVLQNPVDRVDFVFNCDLPRQEYQLSNSYYRHIVFSRKVVRLVHEELGFNSSQDKTHKPTVFVSLSSIYGQEAGFVPQNVQFNDQDIVFGESFKNDISSIEKYMNHSFSNNYLKWKRSVEILEANLLGNVNNNQRLHHTVIIRVPLVGCSLHRVEGYSDKFNALSMLMYQVGQGRVQYLKGNKENTLDLIPVDFLANFALTAAVTSASSDNKTELYNLSTASRNPLRLSQFVDILNSYWSENPLRQENTRSNSNPHRRVTIYEKDVIFSLEKMKTRVPQFLIQKASHLMDLRGPKFSALQNRLRDRKEEEIADRYSMYFKNEWLCESNKCADVISSLDREERRMLEFNVNEIDWDSYIRLYCFGIQKFILRVIDVEHYTPANLNLLRARGQTSTPYFSDIYWALSEGKNYDAKASIEMRTHVLGTPSVRQAIEELVKKRVSKLEKGPESYSQVEADYYKIAEGICDQMFSQYHMRTIRLFAWFLHKVFKVIYEQVVIDKNDMLKLKSYEEKGDGPIVLIPTHRSYMDFLIMSYIFFGYGMRVPHIAAAEDFLNMAVVHILLRKSGAFFIKRSQNQNKDLYKAIMTEYVSKILTQNSHLEFFIEGTRSRVGKMLEPKYGMLTIVTDTVAAGKIKDAIIVPATINYERVLQGASFPFELLGEPKVKQSLGRLIKAVDTLKENYGRIIIELCEPISVKNYMAQKSKEPGYSYKKAVNSMGLEIVYTLSDNLVIMPPAIVASIILMQRKGISQTEVNQFVQWLCKEIHRRGIKIARTQTGSAISVSGALQFMEDIVTKTKKNVFELDLSSNLETTNILMLSYYRNTITHVFFLEAIILTALNSFGWEATRHTGISYAQLIEQSTFLYSLLQKEYVLRDSLAHLPTLERYINQLIGLKVIVVDENTKLLKANEPKKSMYFQFYCSLIWPLVESYWLSLLYFFKLDKMRASVPVSKLVNQIQWFGESMIEERIVEHIESVSQDTIKNAISAYSRLGFIKSIKEQLQGIQVQSILCNAPMEKLKETEHRIVMFLKSSFAKSMKGLVSPGRSSFMLDFPFLAKL